MINKKLIHYNKYEDFLKDLNAGNIKETSIVWIKDRRKIYTHNWGLQGIPDGGEPGQILYMGEDNILKWVDFTEVSDIFIKGNYYTKEEIDSKLNDIPDLTVEEVRDIFYPPTPTIYYTTTNGSQISDSNTRLQDYIVSHTQEPNGEWKIVLNDTLTSIPNSCFEDQRTLKTIRFEGLTNVTSIGKNFLFGCYSLETIDLSGLNNVTSIGDAFISYVDENDISLDISPLNKVTSIGYNFLFASNIKVTDFTPLNKITTIPGAFLSQNLLVSDLDLSSFIHVTAIQRGFLDECFNLKTLTLPNTLGITSIDSNILFDCDRLTTIYCPKGTLAKYKSLMPNHSSKMVELN